MILFWHWKAFTDLRGKNKFFLAVSGSVYNTGQPLSPKLVAHQPSPIQGLRPEPGAVFSHHDSCNFRGQWNTPSASPPLSNTTTLHLHPPSWLGEGFPGMAGAGCGGEGAYSIVKQLVVKVTNSGDFLTTVNASGSLSHSLFLPSRPTLPSQPPETLLIALVFPGSSHLFTLKSLSLPFPSFKFLAGGFCKDTYFNQNFLWVNRQLFLRFACFEIKMWSFLHCPFPELCFQQTLFLRKVVVLKGRLCPAEKEEEEGYFGCSRTACHPRENSRHAAEAGYIFSFQKALQTKTTCGWVWLADLVGPSAGCPVKSHTYFHKGKWIKFCVARWQLAGTGSLKLCETNCKREVQHFLIQTRRTDRRPMEKWVIFSAVHSVHSVIINASVCLLSPSASRSKLD